MALTNYSQLKTAVADWLHRSDQAAKIPDFIALAESRISRSLRTRVVVASLDIGTTGQATLPSDLGELRYIRLNESPYFGALEVVSPVVIADTLDRWQGATGVPARVAVLEGVLYAAPIPDQTYTTQLTYFQELPALSDTNTTNFVLDMAPDLYLAGALIEALLYLEWDERVPAWESKFAAALDELERARERAEFGAAPAPVRLPIVFS